MTRFIIFFILAIGYLMGVHALSARAMAAEQHLASFYTANSDPQALLATSSK